MRRPLTRATLLVVLLVASLAPRSAHAQFGSFIKRKIAEKAAEKVGEKVEEKVAGKDSAAMSATAGQSSGRASRLPLAATPTGETSLGSELTADTLERVLRGLDAAASKYAESQALRRQQIDAERKLADLRSSRSAEMAAYDKGSSKARTCQSAEFRRLSRERNAQVDLRMRSDAAFREHAAVAWQKYMAAVTDAQRKGDSASVLRLQLEMYRELLGLDFDPRKDTIAAVRKCGALPPQPAALVLEDSLSRLSHLLNDRYRQAEIEVSSAGVAQSGLSEQQFARARERIERWYVIKGKGGGAHFWTDREDALLEAQRARIERDLRAFGVQG